MRRFPFLYVVLSLAATLALAGIFYLPYLSVRNKTINAFHEQQTLLLDQAVEGLQGYFGTYEKALKYISEQRSVIDLEAAGFNLIKDFHAIHKSQLLTVLRTDKEGKPIWISLEPPLESKQYAASQETFAGILPTSTPKISGTFPFDNTLVAVMTQPIFKYGHFEGNISFILPCSLVVRQQIESVKIDPNASVMLFSSNATILYARDASLVGKHVSDYAGGELERLYSEMKGGHKGFFTLESGLIDDDRSAQEGLWHGVYLPVTLPDHLSWSILIVTPENEVLGTMYEFRHQWLIVTSIAVLAVSLLSFGLTAALARRNAERKKRRFNEQLVQLLDCAPVGVLMCDPEGIISYANTSVAELVGAKETATLFGKKLPEILSLEDRPRFEAIVRKPEESGPEGMLDARIDGKQYNEKNVIFSVTPFALGQQQFRIVIFQDVTEKRKVEEVRSRLTTAVDQVREIVIITDTRGTIEYVNAAFCMATGYANEESVGRKFKMLWSDDNEKLLFRHIIEVISKGSIWHGRIATRKMDGQDFLAATSISPVKNRDGVVTHFVTVQRDITKEVEFESRVRQAQKMEAIGTLAGGIAHDFNNILGAILGFTDIALLQTDQETEIYDSLMHIRQGGKRAADLVEQILTFSRQSALDKHPVIVAPLIKESLNFLRASLPATIEIDHEMKDRTSKIVAAPVQLQQIVMNLCTNAFYAMREKGGVLTVSLERISREQCVEFGGRLNEECLCLTVKDTGTGMDDNTVDRIFTPFFTTKEPGDGTGMGLSVVLGIVQDLDGDIHVRSEVGMGTTFFVLFPMAKEIQEAGEMVNDVEFAQGNEHILVIDDEKDIRETSRLMLAHFGYNVSTSGNPMEVLSMVQDPDNPVDLVITDLTMPGMTGIELIQKISQSESAVPVILCTGYSDKVGLQEALKAGACDLMMKPVDLYDLSIAVRAALDGKVDPFGKSQHH